MNFKDPFKIELNVLQDNLDRLPRQTGETIGNYPAYSHLASEFAAANRGLDETLKIGMGAIDGVLSDISKLHLTSDDIHLGTQSTLASSSGNSLQIPDSVLGESGDPMSSSQTPATGPHAAAATHVITGTSDDDYLVGTSGNDTIRGLAGDDYISGGAGNDQLHGDAGDDLVYGGKGDDGLYGNAGSDLLFGGEGHDWLYGGDGDDILMGENGNDHLYGGAGDDIVTGGAGNDWLEGSAGNDILTARGRVAS